MSMVNPYEVVKAARNMPSSLKEEMEEEQLNTSLNHSQANDGRKPLTDAYIDNRLRSDKPITFLSFIDDLRRLWEAAGKRGTIIRHSPIAHQAEEFPIITFKIKERKINDQFKDLKPRYRTIIRHPHIDGEYVELYGQVFDVKVEFNVFAETGEEADELVIELEEFLQIYAGFFKRNGVQEILFDSQGEDEVIKNGRIPVAKRELLYNMRFEKIIVRFLNEIQQIAVQANILHEDEN